MMVSERGNREGIEGCKVSSSSRRYQDCPLRLSSRLHWRTSQVILDSDRRQFGGFQLDRNSHATANQKLVFCFGVNRKNCGKKLNRTKSHLVLLTLVQSESIHHQVNHVGNLRSSTRISNREKMYSAGS